MFEFFEHVGNIVGLLIMGMRVEVGIFEGGVVGFGVGIIHEFEMYY